MRQKLALFALFMVSCNQFNPRSHSDTKDSITPALVQKNEVPIPEDAVTADFKGNHQLLYGYVKDIDFQNEKTLIAFENEALPSIVIPESIGAKIEALKLKSFDGAALLVNAKLKDTNFNEYYLFVLKDSVWKQPVTRFDIHKSNMSDTLIPIQVNPIDSTQLLRYYSVFDIDRKSEKKYNWKLLQESVPIENGE